MAGKTLYQKLWEAHLVREAGDLGLLYIDRHLLHEVTSPQAFEGLRRQGRAVRRPQLCLAMPDHNVSTLNRSQGIQDEDSRLQVEALESNVREFQIPYIPLLDPRQGIVHIVGPELGFSLPGLTLVCGDSHTSTHGAFGALAFGIGTSEVEHVLATQTLPQRKSRTMAVRFVGLPGAGAGAKDMALHLIRHLGTAGGTGYCLEFQGEAVQRLSMEARMTLCNMAIEVGARSGLIAPDETTFAYLHGRPLAPKGEAWDAALAHWKTLASDPDACFDRILDMPVSGLGPQVTWGNSPEMVLAIDERVPDPAKARSSFEKASWERALDYMGLIPGTPIQEMPVEVVFIGSCTNGRMEDLKEAAQVARQGRVASGVRALVVPGSGAVKREAESLGLDKVFQASGFEWREPGCSMCLAMNEDRVEPGQRCAATSNRNFEGRMGRGARTHLVSPATAAATALAGHLADPRRYFNGPSAAFGRCL